MRVRPAAGLLVRGSIVCTMLVIAIATGVAPQESPAHASEPYRIFAAPQAPPPWSGRPQLPHPATASSSTCWTYKPDERGFAQKMNEERTRLGKTKLRLDPELSKAARVHTAEMTGKELLHHTSASTLRRRVVSWRILGENVGVGAEVESLHAAFMASPAHRENILFTKYRYAGVGTAEVGGRLWVTVIFESRTNPGTPLRMPSCN